MSYRDALPNEEFMIGEEKKVYLSKIEKTISSSDKIILDLKNTKVAKDASTVYKNADGIDSKQFDNGIDDDTFAKIIACIRIAVPYTGMIISTRESAATRKKVLELGISQISGGSRTSVGGYATPEIPEENSAQFDISDTRTLDEVVNWLLELGHLPSFCTACYRLGRTGDRFMSLVKTGQIANCCAPNALMTLKEYLQDYASPDTYAKGIKLIEEEIQHIPNPKIKEIALRNLKEIEEGKRDFRF